MNESNYPAVNTFQAIKTELGCDDATAAMLTLAQNLESFQVWIKMESDTAYDLRHAGGDVAEAIQALTENGALKIQVEGDIMNSVRAMMDVSTGAKVNLAKQKAAKKKKKTE